MPTRISGVDIPEQKRLQVALTYVFGVGRTRANEIIAKSGLDANIRVKDLSQDEVEKLRKVVESYKVEGSLKQEITENIRRLKEIGSYRGARHKNNLPARGQRTKTNARTKRGKRVTVGSGRKSDTSKGRV